MTDYKFDLKLISSSISAHPFSKKWSAIQLHDEVPVDVLLNGVFEIAGHIDTANKTSIFTQDIDLDDKLFRLVEFLKMLKLKVSNDNLFISDNSVMDLLQI
jgi:hypothetical protein